MLNSIKGWLADRRYRRELTDLRATLWSIQQSFDAEQPLLMFKTGFRIRQQLENRFGAEFVTSIDTDDDLKREGKALDLLPPDKLFQLAAQLWHRADRAGIEQDELFPVIELRLLAGWIKSKAILHSSTNRKVIDEAREHEQLFFFHIGNLLKLARGEKLDLGAPS